MAFELSADEWSWLEQYNGLDLDAPMPPQHILEKLKSLGLIKRKAAGLGLSPRGRKLLLGRQSAVPAHDAAG
jgi:hypothetical protein